MKYREINLIGGFYKDASLPWSAQDTVNWLPVPAQAAGTRSEMKLRGAPGLRALDPDTFVRPVEYITWNPDAVFDDGLGVLLTDANLTVIGSPSPLAGTIFPFVRATKAVGPGRWYWETRDGSEGTTTGTYAIGGIAKASHTITDFVGQNSSSASGPYPLGPTNGSCYFNNVITADVGTIPTTTGPGNVRWWIRHKLDLLAGTYEVAYEGGAFFTVATGISGEWFPVCAIRRSFGAGGNNVSCTANFGASAFQYAVPSGFSSGITR